MTQVIYGTELAAKIRESMKQEIADLSNVVKEYHVLRLFLPEITLLPFPI